MVVLEDSGPAADPLMTPDHSDCPWSETGTATSNAIHKIQGGEFCSPHSKCVNLSLVDEDGTQVRAHGQPRGEVGDHSKTGSVHLLLPGARALTHTSRHNKSHRKVDR